MLNTKNSTYVLKELREGICGLHVGPRALTTQATSISFYWPAIFYDATEVVAKQHDKCQ